MILQADASLSFPPSLLPSLLPSLALSLSLPPLCLSVSLPLSLSLLSLSLSLSLSSSLVATLALCPPFSLSLSLSLFLLALVATALTGLYLSGPLSVGACRAYRFHIASECMVCAGHNGKVRGLGLFTRTVEDDHNHSLHVPPRDTSRHFLGPP